MSYEREMVATLTAAQKRYLLDAFYGRGGWRIVGKRQAMIDRGLCEPGTSLITPLGLHIRHLLINAPA